MTKTPESAQWGSLALVCYIPDPLGSFLHALRQILPGEENPQAHITILPPRPLKLPLDAALQQAEIILERFAPFKVNLSEVDCFPGTKVLYLNIDGGFEPLHEIHAALNTGDLRHDEAFEFRPHLTLGGPVSPEQLESVRILAERTWRASRHSPGFTVREIVGLWSPSGVTAAGNWKRLWSYRLRPDPTENGCGAASGITQTS
ncbi:MAG TPA: 2'-5' RNA ligase family protein [Bryobacteraceae bacterium]|nr:2'-5' RNA ligase family protein [Bryobacteraceae bacterium]